ncbi:MAG: alkylphosphonate utilization protein [Lactococcus cremoris]|uniref:alkylphosphonate utilization protein n=1 Tax=Lactococcus lactis subsp. cremoris TaxID=1359 RepID=UPI001AF0D4E3|nr:alkylphosphonate utilization protein [Lactococcus cremoris]QRZ33559.1 alkylphosphonate utilization protein [Lactococcus cremoris]UXV62110.2 alkylphosphonate utilization protein [Lactococcus cremoris]
MFSAGCLYINGLSSLYIHCSSEYTYELSDTSFGCSECGNEFTLEEIEAAGKFIVLDSLGNELETGDDLVIVQDLPVKGMPKPIKQGTKVKNIRINPEGKNEHFIDSKIPGFGAISLKGSVVKKA